MPEENKRINPDTGKPYPTQKEVLEEITAKIEKGIRDVFDSKKYKEYLSVMSRFHNYSTNNCMLIYMQKPDATRVASLKMWNEKFRRHVIKGEKSIRIIAPAPYKKTIDVQKTDPDTKEPLFDRNGNPVMTQKEIVVPAFKATAVFDVSQTRGRPLPKLAQDLKGRVGDYENMKEAVARSSPVPVLFEELGENRDGFFSPSGKSITIREGMSEPQTLCAMIHEIAHSVLHNPENGETKKPVSTEEIEAESVAYTVCKYFGIDTDENSFGYLAGWSKDKEVRELRSSLDTINETSSLLITDIEKHYEEIQQERREELENADPSSLIFKVGDKAYIHVQRTDDGINYDFSIFRQDNYKLQDGGFTDFEPGDRSVPETLEETARMIAEDFDMENEELTLADESVSEAIDDANRIKGPAVDNGPRYIDEDKIQPPCPEITQGDLERYGYTYDGMYPLDEETAIDLIRNYCDVYLLYPDGTEAMANDEKEIHEHLGYLGVEKENWNRIFYRYETKQELEAKEKAFFGSDKDGFAIYQLKSVYENDDIIFMNSQYLESKNIPVEASRYAFRYGAGMESIEQMLREKAETTAEINGKEPDYNFTTEQKLDCIYEQFNFRKPSDYHSRSVSVSDVLAVKENGKMSFHYVDSIGYKELPGFIVPENYLKNAELSVEDDAGMIDGVINNGAKEKEPEKENRDGKKESILAKLQKNMEQVKSQPAGKTAVKEMELA